ncbi:MAG TPA: TonB-dependent receptor [Gemmatimonadales bacterium]|jgi:iron complex outermembrane receptor protein|nr:TonB-dependent receptor [Gemmatimonadales bacterium]
MLHRFAVGLAISLFVSTAQAQQPTRPDSLPKDTGVVQLPEVTVTVTRVEEKLSQTPAAVSVVGEGELRRGQKTLGLDESLNSVPGVYVANRYNFNLDQRVSIRSFGSRANFGTRGVKILLDGIPQTLPDGQSALSNLDFGNVDRVEVLRGSASSLYGNASGGVLSFRTEPADTSPYGVAVRVAGGSYGMLKTSLRGSLREGRLATTVSASYYNWDGFRQQSASHGIQTYATADYLFGGGTKGLFRFGYTDAPQAQNPGALTTTEWLANPDSAAANNINRKADKNVQQGLLGLGVQHVSGGGAEYNAMLFGFIRDLDNWLATPPPQGPGPTVGTYSTIGRLVLGARVSGAWRLGQGSIAPRLTAGLDLQGMRDDRTNARAVAGVPDTLILDQRERVTELGPFVQIGWEPAPRLQLQGGVRYDLVHFSVQDHHLSDGVDNSGSRDMNSWSGNIGASYLVRPSFTPYVNVSTSFETPTTTELVNQPPPATGGFNSSLNPQRAVNYEAGARGVVGTTVDYSAAFFLGRIQDAIVQYQEVSGRGYFTNAGRVHNDGIELGLGVRPIRQLRIFGNYTWSNYKFAEYRVVQGAVTDTLDGNRVPGVPQAFIRLGLRATPWRGLYLDLDHTMSSSLFADDQNTITIYGFGNHGPNDPVGMNGLTNVRVGWQGQWGAVPIRPFLSVENLWNKKYVAAVTLNGVGGRVLESGPLRSFYVGCELGWTGGTR